MLNECCKVCDFTNDINLEEIEVSFYFFFKLSFFFRENEENYWN